MRINRFIRQRRRRIERGLKAALRKELQDPWFQLLRPEQQMEDFFGHKHVTGAERAAYEKALCQLEWEAKCQD